MCLIRTISGSDTLKLPLFPLPGESSCSPPAEYLHASPATMRPYLLGLAPIFP